MSQSILNPRYLAVVVKVDRRRAFQTTLGEFLDQHQPSPAARENIVRELMDGCEYFGMVGPRSKRLWTMRLANPGDRLAAPRAPRAAPPAAVADPDLVFQPGPDFDAIIAAEAYAPRLVDGVRVR